MIVQRWQAPVFPSEEQVFKLLQNEDLEPYKEEYQTSQEVTEHKHPYDEVRVVFSGELLINVSGNQLLLRAGDRIEIPSNTKHSTKAQGDAACLCICAKRY